METIDNDARDTEIQIVIDKMYPNKEVEYLDTKREIAAIYGENDSAKIMQYEQLVLKVQKLKEEVKTYVCDGAKLQCKYFMGTHIILRVHDKSALLMGVDPIATETDKELKNFEFTPTIEGSSFNCFQIQGQCDVLNAHWEGLAENVLSSNKRVVVITSTLHCARCSEPITIIDNGQEFSDFEGMKNDFLRFDADNAYMFKFLRGGLGIVGSIGLGAKSFGVGVGGGPVGWILGGSGLAIAFKGGVESKKEILDGWKDFKNRKYVSEISKNEKDIEVNWGENFAETFIDQYESKKSKGFEKNVIKGNIKDITKQILTHEKTYDSIRNLEQKFTRTHVLQTIYPDKKWEKMTIDYFKGNTYIVETTEKRLVYPE